MKKRLQTFLFWFILVQPFLDIYWLSRPPLLKFSIPTILRVLGVFIAIILFFSIKNNWQRFRKQTRHVCSTAPRCSIRSCLTRWTRTTLRRNMWPTASARTSTRCSRRLCSMASVRGTSCVSSPATMRLTSRKPQPLQGQRRPT